jgi:hypothetical protein
VLGAERALPRARVTVQDAVDRQPRDPAQEVLLVEIRLRLELRDSGAALLADIRDTKALSDETAAGIGAIATRVGERFTGTLPVETAEAEPEADEPEADEPAAPAATTTA